jgi:hypothetical protein
MPISSRRIPFYAVRRCGATDGGAVDSLAAIGISRTRMFSLLQNGCPSARGQNCDRHTTRFGLWPRRCRMVHSRAPRPHAGADGTHCRVARRRARFTRAIGLGVFPANIVSSLTNISPTVDASPL